MKYSDLYQKLNQNKLYVFSLRGLQKLFPQDMLATLKVQIHWWKKKGWLKPLRRGIYKLGYPEEKNIPDLYIANRLYEPSYVSLETALSIYSIIPEVAMGVTSVTTKPTRCFGAYSYRTIRPKAFVGCRIIKQQGFEILIAEPEKALVDYLYFKLRTRQEISERLEPQILKTLNKKKLAKYADLYSIGVKKELDKIYADL